MKSKDASILESADKLVIRTAGGGGYGDPRKRKPSLIKKDLEDGYVTEEQARKMYSASLA